MTREEEIKLVASCHIAANNEDFKEYYEGFIAGAKWADKTMIEKACEWLKAKLIDNQDNCGYSVVSTFDTTTVEEFICDFKKAMEE